MVISWLDVIPKKVEGKLGLIHHLSHLEEDPVNDHVPKELCSVSCAIIDEIINLV